MRGSASAGGLHLRESEWDPAKHPRTGASPNPGWFARVGEPARVGTNIRSRSGNRWSGDGVLDVLGVIAPEWLPFIEKHITLAQTSWGSKSSTTTVRVGEFGPNVNDLAPGALPRGTRKTIHIEIPTDWTDVQAAKQILFELADNFDAHVVAADWATRKPELFKKLRDQRFRQGLSTVVTLAQGYYTALAGLTGAGQVSVVAWDIQNGDHFGAALSVALLLPIGKFAKAGVEASGTVAIHAGEELLGALSTKLVHSARKLAPEQKALLRIRLLAATSAEEAAQIVNSVLKLKFDRHHPLPKFLGGETKQLLYSLPKPIHDELHAILREELKAAGFTLPVGGVKGSTEAWTELLSGDVVKQGKAFNAIVRASRAVDVKHGTQVQSWVWKNAMGKHLYVAPR